MAEAVIVQEGTLVGIISSADEKVLTGTVQGTCALKGVVSTPVYYEEYQGNYNVIPQVSPQTLQTSDKHLSRDVTVEAIPYYEVDNPQEGQTVIIGGK